MAVAFIIIFSKALVNALSMGNFVVAKTDDWIRIVNWTSLHPYYVCLFDFDNVID